MSSKNPFLSRCIVDLSSKEREGGEMAGVWGNGEQLILQLDEGSLKLIETETGETLNCQVLDNIITGKTSHQQNGILRFLLHFLVSSNLHIPNPHIPISSYPHVLIFSYPHAAQPIHAIRVWGVGRDNGKDFAYVSRDKQTRKHMCHVFR